MTDRALDSTRPLTPEWEQTLDTFAEFQRKHRGTCDATISNHLRVLRRFGAHASAGGVPIRPDEVTPQHIDEFLIGHARPLGRNYARQTACSIRVFMRYLAFLGQVPAERPAQVPTPKVYRLAGLPRGIARDELRRLLRDILRRDARGRRQYAVVMLLATYGLRASDVAALRLDDLRWRESTLWLRRSVKTGRPLVLPLTDAVGDALADYIQRDRPRCEYREVFLSLRAPHHPVDGPRITKIVRETLDQAGVNVRQGVAAHAFRHGFATSLVRSGVALDVIAKCLDHKTTATTEIYTKLAIEDLRSVSFDPRAVLS
jgi:integrase/recombinase XerD